MFGFSLSASFSARQRLQLDHELGRNTVRGFIPLGPPIEMPIGTRPVELPHLSNRQIEFEPCLRRSFDGNRLYYRLDQRLALPRVELVEVARLPSARWIDFDDAELAAVPELDSEAFDFRAASVSFAPVYKLLRRGLETLWSDRLTWSSCPRRNHGRTARLLFIPPFMRLHIDHDTAVQ